MFVEESLWIRRVLGERSLGTGSRVLDIGSASLDFRTRVQPHIAENIYRPLAARGCRILHMDREPGVGVDIAADLCARPLPAGLAGEQFDLVLCCNILEHVEDRESFLANVVSLVRAGGLLLVTVPKRYPRHHDPIDTMYRPGIERLAADVARAGGGPARAAAVVSIANRANYVGRKTRRLDYLLPFRTNRMWRWYLRPFRWQVTCALFERLADPEAVCAEGALCA